MMGYFGKLSSLWYFFRLHQTSCCPNLLLAFYFCYLNVLIHKLYHIDIVPQCKNKLEGACQYSDKSCWFKHSIEKYDRKEQTECEKIEFNEVVEKLFGIVEKVTEQIAKLEKSN